MTGKQKPNYAAVHEVKALPGIRPGDDVVATQGYAVMLVGAIGELWVFFADLEPAMAFGRAGRMSSCDIRSWAVHEALRVIENDPQTLMDKEPVLYVCGQPLQIDLRVQQPAILQHWLDGTSPESSHFSRQLSR